MGRVIRTPVENNIISNRMKKTITYLAAFSIFFSMFTPISLYIKGGQALTILIPSVLIITYDGLFMKQTFMPVALYIATALLLMFVGSEYFTLPSLLTTLFAVACFEHYMVTRDAYFAKVVTFTLYGTLLIMVSTSLPLFYRIPNLSRLMLDAEGNGITSPLFYWTLSYQDIHSLPIYSIPVFYLYRNTKKKIMRIFALAFFAAIFVLMLFADSTGALLVNVAIFGILLLYNQRKSLKTNVGKFAALGVGMALFFNKYVVVRFLHLVQPVFSGSSTYVKINEIVGSIEGSGSSGDIESREDVLKLTWDNLLSNPLSPEFDMSKIGHHNFLLDIIVAMGLFLAITFICFLINRIKRPLRYLTFTAKPYYLVGVIAMLVMGFMKNNFLLMPTCCILPMILIAAENPMVLKIKR